MKDLEQAAKDYTAVLVLKFSAQLYKQGNYNDEYQKAKSDLVGNLGLSEDFATEWLDKVVVPKVSSALGEVTLDIKKVVDECKQENV